MNGPPKKRFFVTVLAALSLLVLRGPDQVVAQQQKDASGIGQSEWLQILHDAHDSVKQHYYDPKLHGLDWDSRYTDYQQKVKQAPYTGAAFALVASFLDGLNDSHTRFLPPRRTARVEYGYRLQLIGNGCFITQVLPGSDAATKVKPGDRVLGWNGLVVNRDDFADAEYLFDSLAPKKHTFLDVISPDGRQRRLTVASDDRPQKWTFDARLSDYTQLDYWVRIRQQEEFERQQRPRWVEKGDVMFLQMPSFMLEEGELDHSIALARKHKTLIVDLRGNPGGRVTALDRMIGSVFDHDVKVGERLGRSGPRPEIAKTRRNNAFSGQLIVLVDSQSASAAEAFARVVQLERRGTVIGDRTSGAVMEAVMYPYRIGLNENVVYGFSVTDSDIRMSDGKGLEHVGVTPDESVLPSPEDLAAGRDPALAHAASLAGVQLDPAEAGKMFPFVWPDM